MESLHWAEYEIEIQADDTLLVRDLAGARRVRMNLPWVAPAGLGTDRVMAVLLATWTAGSDAQAARVLLATTRAARIRLIGGPERTTTAVRALRAEVVGVVGAARMSRIEEQFQSDLRDPADALPGRVAVALS